MLSSDLQPSVIKQSMEARVANKCNIDCYEHVQSTNDIVLDLTSPHNGDYYVCVADFQSKGRGRRAKSWHSPKGDNIYCSVGFVLDYDDQKLVFANLIGTIALLQSIHAITNNDGILVKWPNDICYQSNKLGGVLIETKGLNAKQKLCVAGFGLNVNMRETRTNINQSWTSLLQISQNHYCRGTIIARLLHDIDELLMMDYRVLLDKLYYYWQRYDATYDQIVKLSTTSGIVEGRALGIDRIGRLLIKQQDQSLRAFSDGEVKILR